MTLSWWQIALLYIAGGTLTVWLTFLWFPDDEDTPEDDQFTAGFAFIVWPILWLVAAMWLVLNFPNGIKWLAQRARARVDKKDDDRG